MCPSGKANGEHMRKVIFSTPPEKAMVWEAIVAVRLPIEESTRAASST